MTAPAIAFPSCLCMAVLCIRRIALPARYWTYCLAFGDGANRALHGAYRFSSSHCWRLVSSNFDVLVKLTLGRECGRSRLNLFQLPGAHAAGISPFLLALAPEGLCATLVTDPSGFRLDAWLLSAGGGASFCSGASSDTCSAVSDMLAWLAGPALWPAITSL